MPRFHHHPLSTSALRCLAGLFLLSGVAAAQSETFSSSSLLGPTSQPDSLTLPSFNTDLGTLESVVVSLKFNICPTITVNNTTSAPLAFNDLSITAPFSVSGPGGFTYSSTLSTKALSGTAAPGSDSFEPAVGWIYALKSANTTSLGFWEDQPGSDIDLVITPGGLITTSGASTPSGLQVSGTALEWENVSVKYTYMSTTAVPEPPGKYLAIIVGTVMALFVIGRRMLMSA